MGEAVKVTELPLQRVLEGEAEMLTLAGAEALTVMVTVLEEAGEPLAQASEEVIRQLTWSVFDSEALVYVSLFVPTLLPFSFH